MDVAERFETYEDYLDSQLTQTDLNYLEDEEMARQLVELGYRGLGDTIRREVRFRLLFTIPFKVFLPKIQFINYRHSQDFEARKRLLLERSTQKHNAPRQLASLDKNISDSPFLLVSLWLNWFD